MKTIYPSNVVATITNDATGKTTTLRRSVTHSHPQWVHAQLGTDSETELQGFLDAVNPANWYDNDGAHQGDDESGVSVYWLDSAGAPIKQMHCYTITTDAVSGEVYAVSVAEAIKQWGEAPAHVTDEHEFFRWLRKTGGYGVLKEDGRVLARVSK